MPILDTLCGLVLNPCMTAETLESRLHKKFGPYTGDMPFSRQIPHFLGYSLRLHAVWQLSAGRFGERFILSDRLRDGGPRRKIYSRREMDGLNFSNAVLVTVTFSWSNLRLASFAGAELKDVVFEACDLEGTDFTGATFENVTFKDCLDLENAFLADVRYIPTPHQHQNHELSLP